MIYSMTSPNIIWYSFNIDQILGKSFGTLNKYLKNVLQGKTMIFGWNVNKILEHFGIILLNKPFSTLIAHENKYPNNLSSR